MRRSIVSILPSVLPALYLFAASSAYAQESPPSTPAPPAPPTTPVPSVPPSPPQTVSTTPVAPTASEVEGRRVSATVDSGGDKNAVIERRVSTESAYGRVAIVLPLHLENEKWEQVCVAPCRVDLDRYSTYRVARMNGLAASPNFTLPPNSQALQLKVEPGSVVAHHIGARMTALGSAAAIAGGVMIAAASEFDAEKDVRLAGIITSGAGLLFLGIGIPLMIAGTSHVTANEKKIASSEPARPPAPKLTINGLVF